MNKEIKALMKREENLYEKLKSILDNDTLLMVNELVNISIDIETRM